MNPGTRRILIVDDEEEIREILASFLTPLGLEIFQAANGAAALEMLQHHEIHAILSDIRMPEMTGLELLNQIRGKHYNIPLVFVSGQNDRVSLKEALRLGALDYVEKPFDYEEILEVVGRAVEIGVRTKHLQALGDGTEKVDSPEAKVFEMNREKRMIDLLTIQKPTKKTGGTRGY